MPALDPAPDTPATLSRADRRRACCARSWRSTGSIYTDSMGMHGVTRDARAGRGGRPRRSRPATTSCCIRPTTARRSRRLRRRSKRARSPRRRSTRRSSGSCAPRRAPGCTEVEAGRRSTRSAVGRRHARATRRSPTQVSQRSITLIKDERNQVPLQARRATRRCCTCRCSTIRPAGGSRRRAGRSFPSCASAGRT